MSGLTYDTGALLAAESNDRRMWALHRRALERSHTPTIPAAVVAQAWRGGQQPLLSQFLDSCATDPLDEPTARLAGAMLGRSRSADVVDAIVTSDRHDLKQLAGAVGRRVSLIGI